MGCLLFSPSGIYQSPVRVAILTGAGDKAFSAGSDTKATAFISEEQSAMSISEREASDSLFLVEAVRAIQIADCSSRLRHNVTGEGAFRG